MKLKSGSHRTNITELLQKQRRLLAVGASFLWLVFVVGLYYVNHKPIDITFAVAILQSVWRLLIAWAVLSLCGGIGAFLVKGEVWHPLERFALHAAAGVLLIAPVIYGLGAIIGVNAFLFGGLLLVSLIVLRHPVRGWWQNLKSLREIWEESTGLERWFAAGITVILFANLIQALAPPIKWDALVYHLAIPQAYQLSGHVDFLPWLMFWGMPQLGEALYTWTYVLGGGSAAAVFGWMAGVATLLGVFGYGVKWLNRRSGWITVVALLSAYTLAATLSAAYVDWFTLWFGTALLAVLSEWRRTGRVSYLVLGGLFGGAALGSKYTAGAGLAAGLGVILYTKIRPNLNASKQSNLRLLMKDGLVFVGAAFLAFLPWLAKNLIAVGNPIYPLLMPSGAMDRFRLDFYQIPPYVSVRDMLLLPFSATFSGIEGAPGFSASIGPLFLALAPFAWLGWREKSPGKRLALSTAGVMGLSGLLVWMLGSTVFGLLIQSRLYFVLFPSFAILAAGGFLSLQRLRLPQVRFGRIAGAVLLLVLSLSTVQIAVQVMKSGALNQVAGLDTPEDFLDHNLGWYAPALRAVKGLPQGSQALMLWEARSFYCQPVCEPDEILDRWMHDRHRYGSPQAIVDAWRTEGFTHVLYYRLGAEIIRAEDERYTADDWQALEQVLAGLTAVEDFGEAYTLYTLQP